MHINGKIISLIPFEEIEDGAIAQLNDNVKFDEIIKIAVMPDVHQGYDLPIGAVALVDNHICPSFVGYDIGCGMSLLHTNVEVNTISKNELVDIFNEIKNKIPVGFAENSKHRDWEDFKSASGDNWFSDNVNAKIRSQYGTLGGGNHFIEIGKDDGGLLCIVIHSGSRNPGHKIASFYMDKSKDNKFIPINSELGQQYLTDMNFALRFALANREAMIDEIKKIIGIDRGGFFVNENHNHAVVTEKGVLHRKGATPADKGQLGVIPGSMATGTYITFGMGNETFLSSASHGAGRRLSRGRAKKEITMESFKEKMKDVIAVVNENVLDESPDAYKDIEYVIKAQDGIVVNVINKVTPLINVKGETPDRKKKKKGVNNEG